MLFGCIVFSFCGFCEALTDEELMEISKKFEVRRDEAIRNQYIDPLPRADSPNSPYTPYNKCDYILSALYLGSDDKKANEAVDKLCDWFHNNENPNFYYYGEAGLHWHGMAIVRIYEMFGPYGSMRRNAINSESATKLRELMWEWTKSTSKITDTDIEKSRTWNIWESENHDMMHDSLCWGAAKIFSKSNDTILRKYDDGSCPAEQYDAWTKYFKEYFLERAKRGLFVEVDSPGYAKHTLQCIYNIYDFTEDESLRHRAKCTLDLWWADWAIEQIDAVRGGAKCRSYPNGSGFSPCQVAASQSGQLYSWYYFGTGEQIAGGRSRNHCLMSALMSSYRPHPVVIDLAIDTPGRGCYEYFSRRPGMNLLPESLGLSHGYAIDPDPQRGQMIRYTYCTPDFVMGVTMRNCIALWEYSFISTQNTWHGVIFRGHPDARIYPQCIGMETDKFGPSNPGNTYNQQWAIQNKGTMIAQKLPTTWKTGRMRVWFAPCLNKSEDQGWIFAEAPHAFAAVKPMVGGYKWDDPNWISCDYEFSPVIIEVVQKSDYESFNMFKADILDNKIDTSARLDMTYEGLNDSGIFTVYKDHFRPMEINGHQIDDRPDFTFQSPFINEDYASGVVTISKGKRKVVLDFNQ